MFFYIWFYQNIFTSKYILFKIQKILNLKLKYYKRKYLSILLTLKHQLQPDGTPTNKLSDDVIQIFKELGSNSVTFEEAKKDQVISNYLQKLIENANTRVISKAQHIRKWTLIPSDFSVDGGDLTPTLKLKRRIVEQKWINEIEKMY